MGVPFSSFEVPIAGSGGAIGGAGGAGGAGGMFGTRDAFDDELFAIEGGNDPGTDGLAAELELCAELMTFLSSLLAFISDKMATLLMEVGVQLEPFLRFGFVILLALLVLVVLVAVVVGCCLAKGRRCWYWWWTTWQWWRF